MKFFLFVNKNFKLELMEIFRFMKIRVFYNKRLDKKIVLLGWKILNIGEEKN